MNLSAFQRYIFFLCLIFSLSVMAAPEYVGENACKACHIKEFQEWQGSHHDLAMQEASEATVLGDFNHTSFIKDGVKTNFFKKNKHFMVNTDGADGQLQDYKIAYTFGVYPLQQYMVKFPQGKIQVLDIAWDSRTKEQGGQRWFSLHPDEKITAGDVLHWTGPNLNWNYMCADCHSTNLKKNYNETDHSYTTQWDAINVSCEACHGPASEHIKLAEKKNEWNDNKGLSINFSALKKRQWLINKETGKPMLSQNHQTSIVNNDNVVEVEMCAKCHSRRAQLDDDFVPGDNFRAHYLPALLTNELYYHDGKIKDEVYVYGSFLQSKMYQAGVICSDCHNMHSLELKAPEDKVCQQCHISPDYASSKHHFHKEESTGASCIACHMPVKIYMGVDQRNDHSFRIPRPDLAQSLNIPDACTNCHQEKNSQWSANAIKKWYGKTPKGYQQFGPALHSINNQKEQALTEMYDALFNGMSDIAKATIVSHLGDYPSRQTLMTAVQMLKSKNADIRRSALQSLAAFPAQYTIKYIYPKLNDPVKIVRLEAARILAAVPRGSMEKVQKDLIDKVTEEYRQSLLFNAERPESQVSLAQLYRQLGQVDKAEAAFKEALILQPQYIPAYVNYANFLQHQNKESESFKILQRGLKQTQGAALYHSLGLWYVRNKHIKDANEKMINFLLKATEVEPDNAHYQYVYAVAIGEKQPQKAIEILIESLQRHSGNLETLSALSSYYKQIGDDYNSIKYHKKMEKMMQYKP